MYVDTNIFTFMKLDSLYWKLMEYNYNGKVVQNYIAFIMLSGWFLLEFRLDESFGVEYYLTGPWKNLTSEYVYYTNDWRNKIFKLQHVLLTFHLVYNRYRNPFIQYGRIQFSSTDNSCISNNRLLALQACYSHRVPQLYNKSWAKFSSQLGSANNYLQLNYVS